MPIYMDRHDVSESVTAENVAQLHQKDLKIQAQFGCRGLTYWFDDKRKTAFCLIEAPDMEAIKKMHDCAHGDVPHSIIEVDYSIVESFLGRIQDPENAQNAELNIIDDPAFRTIMVISLNQSLVSKAQSMKFESAIGKFNKAVRKILKVHNGKTVKQTDFHYLVSFKSVTNAIQAAMAIQLQKKQNSKEEGNIKMNLKIGLNAGVPVTKKQVIFEDTIKLAERMCSIVNAEIILTAEVKDLYKSENANAFVRGKDIVSLTIADEKFIGSLMDYTEAAWNNINLNTDNFCKSMGLSKSQLYRKLRMLTGKSPNTFIKDYRLNEALKRLNKSVGNVSEIAFETGFSSPSYFAKCFQKKYGHIPSDYLLLNSA